MKRLLVTGASGFLGWNLCAEAMRQGWHVTGTVHRHVIEIPDSEVLTVDLREAGAVRRLFDRARPDAVAHLAAVSQPNACEERPEQSRELNVEATRTVAEGCAEAGVPLVFTSSDLVFDGSRAPYREDDAVSPVNEYGRQKAAAERVLAELDNVAVCRMPLMYGDPGPVATSFIQPWIASLRRGDELRLFVDEYRTPVSGRDAARGLLLALRRPGQRYHLGGTQRISRYEFGRCLAAAFGLNGDAIRASSQADVTMSAPRPPDVSLDSTKARRELGYAPSPIEQELAFLAKA
ncbi:MAG: sugar nucleotide-binding protein [Chitinivibrionales bacterium]|nr:sugar nucleotide-binding protein [Chitinivibrionales bacterium]